MKGERGWVEGMELTKDDTLSCRKYGSEGKIHG